MKRSLTIITLYVISFVLQAVHVFNEKSTAGIVLGVFILLMLALAIGVHVAEVVVARGREE